MSEEEYASDVEDDSNAGSEEEDIEEVEDDPEQHSVESENSGDTSEDEYGDGISVSGEEDLADSDLELQEAYARGELKPGLVRIAGKSKSTKIPPVNNIPRLNSVLEKIKLPSSYEWIEKLDVTSELAPLAPEIAFQLDEHREKRERVINNANARKRKKGVPAPLAKTIEDDPIHNDFKRELNFHRQAQSAVLASLPKIKSLGILTKRPTHYFAEMAKSDAHMQKVASVLLKKQTAAERSEKVRRMREQKKIAKQTQIQVTQQRQKAKKELIENVKKYRKGQSNSLDFLDDKKTAPSKGKDGSGSKGINRRREMKNEFYGYGGKKRGLKRNTRASLDNFEEIEASKGRRSGRGAFGGGRMGNRGGGGRNPPKNAFPHPFDSNKEQGGGGGGFSRGPRNIGNAGNRKLGKSKPKKPNRPGKEARRQAKARS